MKSISFLFKHGLIPSYRVSSKQENRCYLMFLLLFLYSCGNVPNKEGTDSVKENLIQVTKDQFESGGLQIAEVTDQYFTEEVKCNGYITAPINAIAQISPPISGVIEKIYFDLNDYVRKGQSICELSSNEFMILQHDFAETSARLIKLKADYERIKILYNEDIGAKKEYISAESEYKVVQAKYLATKMRLERLGLDISKIEEGIFYNTFPVVAPISGYLIRHHISLGQYSDALKILAEIVDVNQLQLQLSVFENDITKLKASQTIRFTSTKEPELTHLATLTTIGRAVIPESKTIQCIAKINPEKGNNFINQSYIEAVISVDQKLAKALPNDALIKQGKDFYVMSVDKYENSIYFLRKLKVAVGRISNQYTEILDVTPGLKVISKGAYFFNAE